MSKIQTKPANLSKFSTERLKQILDYDLTYAQFKQRKFAVPRFKQVKQVKTNHPNRAKVNLQTINAVYKNEQFKNLLKNSTTIELANKYQNYSDALKKFNKSQSTRAKNNFRSAENSLLKELGISTARSESKKDVLNKLKIKFKSFTREDLLAYKAATDAIKKLGIKVVDSQDINSHFAQSMETIRMNLIKKIKPNIDPNDVDMMNRFAIFIQVINSPDKADEYTLEEIYLKAQQFGFKV